MGSAMFSPSIVAPTNFQVTMPTTSPRSVDQRAPAVAGIERRVGLHPPHRPGLLVGELEPLQERRGGHDARGDYDRRRSGLQRPRWKADDEDPVAEARRGALRYRRRLRSAVGQRHALQHGHVGQHATVDQHRFDLLVEFVSEHERRPHVVLVENMGVGQDDVV